MSSLFSKARLEFATGGGEEGGGGYGLPYKSDGDAHQKVEN